MTDLVSLVLNIPGSVEGFVELGRVVMKYQSLERDHVETVEESIFIASTLNYYAGFVNVTYPKVLNHPSRPLLEEALRNAHSALQIAEGILNYWSERLHGDMKTRKQTMLKKITKHIANKIIRPKSNWNEENSRVTLDFKILFTKASYLAFGSVEIKEAMIRLNKWTTRLSQLLLTSPNLQLRRDVLRSAVSNDVAFVASARRRAELKKPVSVIDLLHLDSTFDIDPLHDSTIYRIKDGDYSGYIVDVRHLCLSRDSILEEEARGTEHICRLFADTPSDGEYKARATVGILPCAGYAIEISRSVHYLLFRPPAGTGTPKTLRSLLLSGRAEHPLNARLDFCFKLATSVLIIHSVGLVHKNIRPDSIIVTEPLRTDSKPESLGTPYLLSFGQARDAAGPTSRFPYAGEALMKTLYIHPRHLVPTSLRKKYQMRDDIYSLGLCFLEIAIWRSIIRWRKKKNGFACDFGLVQMSDQQFKRILKDQGMPTEHDKCWLRRDTLVRFASKHVPPVMDNTFRDIVVDCLLFGEEELPYGKTLEMIDEEDSHDETADAQSVMFVQNILSKLRSLVFSV